MLASAACGGDGPDDGDLAEGLLLESVTFPYERDGLHRGITSNHLRNDTGAEQVITAVRIGRTSPEIKEAKYLGWSTCRRKCVDAALATDEVVGQAERSIDGTVPIRLDPDDVVSLVFDVTYEPGKETGPAEQTGECAWAVLDIVVDTEQERSVRLTGSGYRVTGVRCNIEATPTPKPKA